MTETQLLTVALTTVPTMIVILIGILINNARLNDVKETLRAEMRSWRRTRTTVKCSTVSGISTAASVA